DNTQAFAYQYHQLKETNIFIRKNHTYGFYYIDFMIMVIWQSKNLTACKLAAIAINAYDMYHD
ncbi:hypothetical protein, partial [Richelia intracellularis]|uniref:hypothetical protein n=1 Tax=Richelia intracellularis TaxID=1164990 RepID=UPI001E452D40